MATVIEVRFYAERDISSLGVDRGWDEAGCFHPRRRRRRRRRHRPWGWGASARGKHTLLYELSSYLMNSVLTF